MSSINAVNSGLNSSILKCHSSIGVVYMIHVGEPGDSIFKEEEESIKQLILERDLESTPFLFVIRGDPESSKGIDNKPIVHNFLLNFFFVSFFQNIHRQGET